ncbi:tetratricopeptide repeat protein [Ekhidna sp.]|uniref:ATP-binding protein n=1 Tax=Ekhidna sp. TaxID=2608089 RepID=UPI003BA8FA8C
MRYLTLIILLTALNAFSQSKLSEASLQQITSSSMTCDEKLDAFQALDILNAVKSNLKAEALLQLGLTHYCLGNFEKALTNYQESLDLFSEFDSKEKPAEILNLIGTLQKKQGNFELANNYFNQGLEYAIAKNDSLGIGNSLNNIGVLLFQQEKFSESLDYYLESTEVKSAISDTIGLSYNYDNLGMVYTRLNKIDSAKYYFNLAAKYKLMIGDEVGYGIVKNNIGEMLLEEGLYSEAENYFKEALEIAQKTSYTDFEQYVLSMISIVREQRGDYKAALSFFKDHTQLKDSLFNERKSQQVAELETKYQTEKKEQTIVLQAAALQRNQILLVAAAMALILLITIGLLWRNRTKKKQQIILQEAKIATKEAELRAAIASQEKERSRYARDLHDGFGQMISILNMNLQNLKDGAKLNERQKVFEESSKVIDDMYGELKNICFDLMPQTLIKNGLESGLREFVDRINGTGKIHIELNVFGLENRLSELQEISLYRISQEWINNILKYSDATKVTLQITKDEEEITLLIEDNGTGFDRELLRDGKGNGWKNLNTRANLIKGSLELETYKGVKGNTLILNAPILSIVEEEVEQNTMELV